MRADWARKAATFCLTHLAFDCEELKCHVPIDGIALAGKMGTPRERVDVQKGTPRKPLFGVWSERCCVYCHVMMQGLKCRLCGRLTEQYHHATGNAFVRHGRRVAAAMSGPVPVTRSGWRL